MVHPTKEAFKDLARTANVIPVYQEILADTETPIRILKTLDTGHHSFLLESVEGGEKWSRYSFIGMDPMLIFQSNGNHIRIESDGEITEKQVDDPLRFLENKLAEYQPAPVEGLPRFFGGAVGYMGYETVSFFEPIPDTLEEKLNVPDTWFIVPRVLLIFDALRQSIKVLVDVHLHNRCDPDEAYDDAVEKISKIITRLGKPTQIPVNGLESEGSPTSIVHDIPQKKYEAMVQTAKEYIRQGEIIQVVLSQRFQTETQTDPLNVYRALRRINPSPYLFFLDFAGTALIGSSPEVMVRLEGKRITLRPIAGTRPRGKTESEDKALEEELLADPKERAEHVMLVDLARNDVGRVAEYDSVDLTDLMVVEHYSHVMHIVSNVEGLLKNNLSAFDVLRASFPAGTVSGAPKVRAMEIIHELEADRRGPYSGAVGYFGFDGNMDLAITIRTIVMKDGKAYVQTGAGIVADSDPKKEFEETVHKASALFEALRKTAQ